MANPTSAHPAGSPIPPPIPAPEPARHMAGSVAQQTREAASTVSHKAEGAAATVGEGMTSMAQTLREQAPRTGMLGSAASNVADTLERGGRYLQEEGLGGMGEELTNLIRRNPLPALLIGFGVGYLIARATRS